MLPNTLLAANDNVVLNGQTGCWLVGNPNTLSRIAPLALAGLQILHHNGGQLVALGFDVAVNLWPSPPQPQGLYFLRLTREKALFWC